MVLDTSVCVDILRETSREVDGPALRALAKIGGGRIYLSLFSLCELQTGVRMARRSEEEHRRLAGLVSRMTILRPDDAFPILYGEAAAELLKAGTPIPVMDLLIGITAKSHGLPILTRDTRHFRRIPGLVVEGYGDTETRT